MPSESWSKGVLNSFREFGGTASCGKVSKIRNRVCLLKAPHPPYALNPPPPLFSSRPSTGRFAELLVDSPRRAGLRPGLLPTCAVVSRLLKVPLLGEKAETFARHTGSTVDRNLRRHPGRAPLCSTPCQSFALADSRPWRCRSGIFKFLVRKAPGGLTVDSRDGCGDP